VTDVEIGDCAKKFSIIFLRLRGPFFIASTSIDPHSWCVFFCSDASRFFGDDITINHHPIRLDDKHVVDVPSCFERPPSRMAWQPTSSRDGNKFVGFFAFSIDCAMLFRAANVAQDGR
jgi:hypothetical protein